MPLHPQAQAIADFYAAMRTTPFEELTPTEARAMYAAGQVPSVEVVHEIREVLAGTIPCRLYRPSSKTDLGLLVFFHGGGWVLNFLDIYEPSLRKIANHGKFIIIAVEYQKAPENPYPTPFNDCYEGLKWTIENASELGIDPLSIGVGGDHRLPIERKAEA